jgi:hypothetical protein
MRNAIIASAWLTAALCGTSAAADPALTGLIMPDAKVVGGIHLAQAKATPFGRYILGRLAGEEKGFQELLAATGFDPRRDLVEVLFASSGDPGSMTGLVLARGAFDPVRIGALIRGAGRVPETYQGVEIYTGKQDSKAVAFLDSTTAVAGEIDLLKAVIDRRAKPTVLDPTVSGRIATLSANQHAWALTVAPVANLSAQAPDTRIGGLMQGDLFKTIEYAGAAFQFGDNVLFKAEAVTHTEKDASAMADALRFLASLAAMQGGKNGGTQFAGLLQAMKLASAGNVVTLSAEVPEADFEKLLGQQDALPAKPAAER